MGKHDKRRDEKPPAPVVEIHNVENDPEPPPPSVPPPPRVTWIVPRAYGRPTAHAVIGDAKRTACGAMLAAQAVYPPAPSLPRCEACEEKVDPEGTARRKAAREARAKRGGVAP